MNQDYNNVEFNDVNVDLNNTVDPNQARVEQTYNQSNQYQNNQQVNPNQYQNNQQVNPNQYQNNQQVNPNQYQNNQQTSPNQVNNYVENNFNDNNFSDVAQPYTNYNNSTYDTGNANDFEGPKKRPITIWILLAVIIIILIILLAKYCGIGSKLTDLALSDIPVMYVDEEYKITASAVGKGDLENTIFTFDISDKTVAEGQNGIQAGVIADEIIKAKAVGETTISVSAQGKNSKEPLSSTETITVCDRLDIENIANNTITINLNDTADLGLNVGTSKKCLENLKFNFKDSGIAKIDENHKITGVTAGTTTFTVSDGQNEIPYTVTVVDPNAKILASSVSLNVKSITLVIGQQRRVYATIVPKNVSNTKIYWSSSKSGVASVSGSGLIKAKSVGVTYITAKTGDGSDKVTTVKVTVIKPKTTTKKKDTGVKVSSMSFANSTLSVAVGQTATAGVNILPTNAKNKTISCKSSNTSYATVTVLGNACVVKGVSAGTVTITATANDGSGKTANITVTITAASSGGSGSSGSSCKNKKSSIKSSCSCTCSSGCRKGCYNITSGPNKGKVECFCR